LFPVIVLEMAAACASLIVFHHGGFMHPLGVPLAACVEFLRALLLNPSLPEARRYFEQKESVTPSPA
jgi:hypothetical protein